MVAKQEIRWWLPLLIVAVIATTLTYQWRLHHLAKPLMAGDYIDTIAEQLTVLRYNEQGQLMQNLTSPRAEHYSLSRTTHFIKPHVLVYPTVANRAVWQLTADKAILSSDKDHLDLQGHVDMHEVLAIAGKQLLTPQLTWYTDKKIAITHSPLIATEPGVKVTAIGATFDQALGVIHLESHVVSQYQPITTKGS